MKKIQLLALLVFAFNWGFSQDNSRVDFIIKNLGVNVDGHFNTFSITSKFDTSNTLESIRGEITVKSIETGINSRDEHLLEEDYFNIKNHPKITLISKTINKKSSNSYTVKANLMIKGKTKLITIPITVSKTNSKRKISSEFEINRRDFDVGGGSLVMGKTVKIKVVHIESI
ncbi:MAG: YceI family protein [Winogradskyella sp.]|uniref:YceI family protein n=1 Tax=Winogradskyella sp. TaxID=1883156 RepID=UPI000F3D5D0C|nr:YceI family protein [Winogradskyella sp.]RNC88107.1 MAG: YceI family protein [Winogradskyella sp.]